MCSMGVQLLISSQKLDSTFRREIEKLRADWKPIKKLHQDLTKKQIRFGEKDYIKFTNNKVLNLQEKLSSRGARGGALYIGAFTSMVINGEFENNSAETPYLSPKNKANFM